MGGGAGEPQGRAPPRSPRVWDAGPGQCGAYSSKVCLEVRLAFHSSLFGACIVRNMTPAWMRKADEDWVCKSRFTDLMTCITQAAAHNYTADGGKPVG